MPKIRKKVKKILNERDHISPVWNTRGECLFVQPANIPLCLSMIHDIQLPAVYEETFRMMFKTTIKRRYNHEKTGENQELFFLQVMEVFTRSMLLFGTITPFHKEAKLFYKKEEIKTAERAVNVFRDVNLNNTILSDDYIWLSRIWSTHNHETGENPELVNLLQRVVSMTLFSVENALKLAKQFYVLRKMPGGNIPIFDIDNSFAPESADIRHGRGINFILLHSSIAKHHKINIQEFWALSIPEQETLAALFFVESRSRSVDISERELAKFKHDTSKEGK